MITYQVGDKLLIDVTEFSDFERFVTYRTAHLTLTYRNELQPGPPPESGLYISCIIKKDYAGKMYWGTYGKLPPRSAADIANEQELLDTGI